MTKRFRKHARVIRTLIAGGGVVGLMLAAVLPRNATGIQDQRTEIERMMREFLVAFGNRDVAAFSAYFADDATNVRASAREHDLDDCPSPCIHVGGNR